MFRIASLVCAAVLLSTTASASVLSTIRNSATGNNITVSLAVEMPPSFLHHVDVKVSWTVESGTFDPVNDYLTVWWEPFKSAYTEYVNITAQSGSYTFSLLNARYPYLFRYYRGDDIVVESAARVQPEGSYPMGVRTLLVPGDDRRVQIMWTSNRSMGTNTIVRYGLDKSNLNMTAPSIKSLTYTQKEFNDKVELPPIKIREHAFPNLKKRALRCIWGECYNDFTASELFVDPGFFHVAEIDALLPGTKYWFQVGEVGGHFSEVRYFRSRIPAGPETPISILYFADAGAGHTSGGGSGSAAHNGVPVPPSTIPNGARHVFDAARADPQIGGDDMSIMNGDVSYARGWPFIWELFHNETEDIFGQIPVMVAYGNHEYDYGKNTFQYCRGPDSGGEAGIATARRYNFKSEDEPWYWIKYGPVALFAMSSEHSISAQQLWLREELPKVNRTETPWLIVFFHRPVYESNTFFSRDIVEGMINQYVDLWVTYGVDLVLSGHAHYYERMCAISNNRCATWGYRDSWHSYHNVELADGGNYCTKTITNITDFADCRAACAMTTGCTGMKFYSSTCKHLTCAQPFNLTYAYDRTIWSMDRLPGQPPVYIVDGTAGGVFTPVETPHSPLTEYKDFSHFGYSRLRISKNTLKWEHHHIDGSIVDNVTLSK